MLEKKNVQLECCAKTGNNSVICNVPRCIAWCEDYIYTVSLENLCWNKINGYCGKQLGLGLMQNKGDNFLVDKIDDKGYDYEIIND